MAAAGSTRDFYPTFGAFETTLHPTEIGLGGRRERLSVAKANQVITVAMAAAGAEALIGTDLMQRLGPTRFQFPRRYSLMSVR